MSKSTITPAERWQTSQLRELLTLATDKPEGQGSLPASVKNREEFVRMLTELCEESEESGEILLSTVCSRETPVEALTGIKELAKTLLANASTDAHRAAATFLYHLAIAAALGRYGMNVSTVTPDSRLALYEDLASALAGDPLGEVFREAVDRVLGTDEHFA